jgi:PTS system galactitol-specific IIC component
MDSIFWGFFAAVICYIITLIIADYTAPKVQGFYDKLDGISLPQPFCAGYVPFAIAINKGLDAIPGINKIDIDAQGMKDKFGLFGEPLFLGVIIGTAMGFLAEYSIPLALALGVKMGAVMELIPRITGLFIEGLLPISNATKELIAKKFKKSAGLHIGMSPALVIGHPATLVVTLLTIPMILFFSVILPGNEFLPLASLAGIFYVYPLILPITKGNVFKTFIIGLILLVGGVYIATNLAQYFTLAANDVYAMTGDAAVKIPEGFSQAASIDFAASPFTWIVFHLTHSFKFVGVAVLVVFTGFLMWWNRKRIVAQNETHEAEFEQAHAKEQK